MHISRRLEVTLLGLVCLAALVLRTLDLRGTPPGAQHDEVFSANFASQIIDGARPVYWDQNGGIPVFHSYLVAPVFALLGPDIISLRLVSVLCGVLAMLFTFLAARRMFGSGTALFSAALMSVTQWHLFESRVGLEPVTLTLMAALTAWLFVRSDIAGPARGSQPHAARRGAGEALHTSANPALGVPDKAPSFWWGVPTGLALGLTMYTYQSAPLVGVALAAFVGWLCLRERARLRAHARWLGVMTVVALLVMLPVPVHFLTTAGDATSRPEELAADLRAATQGDLEPLARDAAGVVGMLAFEGDPSWRYNLAGRPVFTLGIGLLAYGGLALAAWRWREPRYAFVLLWITINVLASAVTRASPSYLRSSSALPFIVILPGMALAAGWDVFAKRASRLAMPTAAAPPLADEAAPPRPKSFGVANSGLSRRAKGDGVLGISGPLPAARWLPAAFVALALGLLAWEGASTVRDYFMGWARDERVLATYRADLADVAAYLDAEQPAGTIMLSARFPSDLDQGALYLLQRQKQQLYQWFNGRRVLVLPADTTGRGVRYFIPATNASLGDGAALLQTLPAQPGPRSPEGSPLFTLYTLSAPELSRLRAREPQIALHANINAEVELIGVDPAATGRRLHLLLYWRVAHRVPGDRDRSFFAHLVDASGRLWTQEDRSVYPTSSWHDDDIAWQWYDLQLPADAPAGSYWVELGVYDANAPGQPRLPVLDEAGNPTPLAPRAGPFDLR